MSRARVVFDNMPAQALSDVAEDEGSSQREDYFSAEEQDVDVDVDGEGEGGFDDGDTLSPYSNTRRRASLQIRLPPTHAKADMAFTALQYLPMPIMVLSSMKTVVLANEAMGRLLGIDYDAELAQTANDAALHTVPSQESRSPTDILYGQTLARLGLDLLQGGSAVMVSWESFLETLVNDAARTQNKPTHLGMQFAQRDDDEDVTPTGSIHHKSPSGTDSTTTMNGSRTMVHDAVMDVVFSTNRDPRTGLPIMSRSNKLDHIQSQMICSVWSTGPGEDEQFFTLTFTAARTEGSSSSSSSASASAKATSRTVSRSATVYSNNSAPSGHSSASSSSSRSDLRRSHAQSPPATATLPSPQTQQMTQFPPRGPPGKSTTEAPSMFTKTNKLKEALLNSMSIPAYAMWKDESFGIPNKAAVKLIYPWIQDGNFETDEQARDFLSRYILYHGDFSSELPFEEYPILKLMKDRKRFEGYRVGMYSVKDGNQILFDVTGEPLVDGKGEFIGGIVLFNDVTEYATTIHRYKTLSERQFENICNAIPQLIWRTDPQGNHDYYNDQWYSYTGLSVEESEGEGWLNAFDNDDLTIAEPKWRHSLATGDEYLTEYRCKSANGEWRWMLGRATPMKDENGDILK